MILVSACLCGVNCKYSGGNNLNEKAVKLLEDGKALLVCPEQLGGLTTPRVPSEIVGGSGVDVLNGKAKVMSKEGKDVTEEFVKGAEETLALAKTVKAEYVILKAKSPSCGNGIIYAGHFNGDLREGEGVTTALLKKHGFKVITENDIV